MAALPEHCNIGNALLVIADCGNATWEQDAQWRYHQHQEVCGTCAFATGFREGVASAITDIACG